MSGITSVILAGGVGTRLWPLSRTNYPKQFLQISGEKSLFQETYTRALKISDACDIYIVTNELHQFLVQNQIREQGTDPANSHILKEPVGRNTLPAITWAVREVIRHNSPKKVVVFPSDHSLDENAIHDITNAISLTDQYLVTFGVRPTSPHTGYGYIAPGVACGPGMTIQEFKEKPDKITAQQYLKDGYLWNSGIFLFDADLFCEELTQYAPDIALAFHGDDPDYHAIRSISIDYGLMEKTEKGAVVPLTATWSDLGTFQAWYCHAQHDSFENVGDFTAIDATGNYVHTGQKHAALIGVSNLVVVDTDDALLVCSRDETERVGTLVSELKAQADPITEIHRHVYRPWGAYTELERCKNFRIKRITVMPGEKLSLQMHRHRSEHWIVVSGMADVSLGDETYCISAGESTFVKAGTRHRLGNSGILPLEVIEVQIGEYLEENDIERYDDTYGRI